LEGFSPRFIHSPFHKRNIVRTALSTGIPTGSWGTGWRTPFRASDWSREPFRSQHIQHCDHHYSIGVRHLTYAQAAQTGGFFNPQNSTAEKSSR
jgi:hypothetical protein